MPQNWILPENLIRQSESERQAVDSGNFTGEGDFGSYYAYRKGINRDWIREHAIVDDGFARLYVQQLSYVLAKTGLTMEGNILDVGCAIGTVTDALQSLSNTGEAVGLDISEDAIAVARQRYPGCRFVQQSADRLDLLSESHFDIIHAREFYPFTRTNDMAYQVRYLSLFQAKLSAGGAIVLQMANRELGLPRTYKRVFGELPSIGYRRCRRIVTFPVRLFKVAGPLLYAPVAHWFLGTLLLRSMPSRSSFCFICEK